MRHNSWASKGSASTPHSSEDTSFHCALYPSGDRSELPPITATAGRTRALCVLYGVNTGRWAVRLASAMGQKPVLNQTRPLAVHVSKYDSAKMFCWHSTSQTKWCLKARNIILIYYLMSQLLAMGAILYYEPQWVLRPWAAELLVTPQDAWGHCSGDEVNVTVSSSLREGETVKQRRRKVKIK